MYRFFGAVIVFLEVLSVISGSQAFGSDLLGPIIVDRPSVRVEAPAFTLTGMDGKKASLNDYRGKVVLLNFWASWCAPCREEMPALEKLWLYYKKRDFVIIAIAADRRPEMARNLIDKLGITFPALFDTEGDVRKRYEVAALPTTYLIGKDGKISGRVIGAAQWDGDSSRKLIEKLLGQAAAR